MGVQNWRMASRDNNNINIEVVITVYNHPILTHSNCHLTWRMPFIIVWRWGVIKECQVEEDQELWSYDFAELFTSVPVDKLVDFIKCKLEDDPTLWGWSNMSHQQVSSLLEFCLGCTYFVFNGPFCRKIHGVAMGYMIVWCMHGWHWGEGHSNPIGGRGMWTIPTWS